MRKVRRIQRAPAPIPDFQVDAAEDIKSETRGILRDLLLALAKVRGLVWAEGSYPTGEDPAVV